MKLLDQNTSGHFHIPELVLMEQAAMHFVWKLCDVLRETKNKKGIVFCGLGNNGADGIAIARLLNERGMCVEICKVRDLLNEKKSVSESFSVQESIYDAYKYPVIHNMEQILENKYDFVIDAVFGIGLTRPLNEEYVKILNDINEIKSTKVAVDMPSGVNSDNGQIMGAAVNCDYTITFSFEKLGQYIWPGCECAGKTYVVDMGITEKSWLERKPSMAYLEKKDLRLLPERPAHSNKGTFGKLLVIAGSKNMAGAAIFTAKAAYRTGVGLVKIFTCAENREIIQTSIPEALISTYDKALNKEQLITDLKWADAVVIGPGIGCGKIAEEMIELVRSMTSVPVLWDADALNLLSQNTSKLLLPHTEFVMTPHLGEFSRMTNHSIEWIQNHFIESAIDFARTYDVICVLKDFHTLTINPYGLSFLNITGNNGMATGGSGDVLSGVIGALLAQGLKASDAAAYGVYIHSLAGDMAKEHTGYHAMIASDIVEALKEVWRGTEYAQ